jgi:transcriptional regulator with XRE-family HTH domain
MLMCQGLGVERSEACAYAGAVSQPARPERRYRMGENLRRLREAAGFATGADFARSLGVTVQQLNDWENRREFVDTKTLIRLAKGARCLVEDIVAGVDVNFDAMARDLIRQRGVSSSALPVKAGDHGTEADEVSVLKERNKQLEQQLAVARDTLRKVIDGLGAESLGQDRTPPPRAAGPRKRH